MTQLIYDILIYGYYFFLSALVIAFAVIVFMNGRRLVSLLGGISRRTWLTLFIIMSAGLFIRIWAVPHTHHVYFDEFEHLNGAENLFYRGIYCATEQGTGSSPEVIEPLNWPPMYHYLLSVAFAAFGPSEAVAFELSSVLGALSVLLVFLLAYLLLNDQRVAIYAAFLFNLIPVHLKYSGSSETGITSLFFILWALISGLIYVRRFDTQGLWGLILSLAVALYCRPENFFLLVLVPGFVLLFLDKNQRSSGTARAHLIVSVCSLMVLAAPYLVHMLLGQIVVHPPGWEQGTGRRLLNLKEHVIGNLWFWSGPYHPSLVTLLALAGIPVLWKQDRKILLFSGVWFFSLLVLYSSYHIGVFDGLDSDRFALNLYVSVVFWAGVGLAKLFVSWRWRREWFLTLVLVLIGLQSAGCFRENVDRTFSRDVHKEYQLILACRDIVPDDVHVLAYNPPSIVSAMHKKAVAVDVFRGLSSGPRSLVLFKDHWYAQKAGADGLASYLQDRYDFEVLCGDGRSAFIRLRMKQN